MKLKKITEKKIKAVKKNKKDGRYYFPQGEYPEKAQFPDFAVFPYKCRFGRKSTFGSHTIFGTACKFGENCQFGGFSIFGHLSQFKEKCTFGGYTLFGAECSFGEKCWFGNHSKFGRVCSFRRNTRFGADSKFGEYCVFYDNCSFDEYCDFGHGCRFGPGCRAMNLVWPFAYVPPFKVKGKIYPSFRCRKHWEKRLNKKLIGCYTMIYEFLKPHFPELLKRDDWTDWEKAIIKSWAKSVKQDEIVPIPSGSSRLAFSPQRREPSSYRSRPPAGGGAVGG